MASSLKDTMTHAQAAVFAALLLFASGCSTPTLQQRQDNWRRFRDVTRATCAVGQGDPAMPPEVREWCARTVAP